LERLDKDHNREKHERWIYLATLVLMAVVGRFLECDVTAFASLHTITRGHAHKLPLGASFDRNQLLDSMLVVTLLIQEPSTTLVTEDPLGQFTRLQLEATTAPAI
jgi:hypothetical protein